mgnify:CR=1 FL=1
MTIDIGSHTLQKGTSVKLKTNGFKFTCALDNHATFHYYPRKSGLNGPDPAYNTAVKITATTDTTITLDVGKSSNQTEHILVSAVANSVISGGAYVHTFENAKLEAAKEGRENTAQEEKPVTQLSQANNVNIPQTDDPINPDPRAEAWAAKNSWFGTDRAMTYTAFEIHKDLTEKEGYDPSSDEYYAEVDKRIRVDFPHKFGNTDKKQSTAPVQTVASANRSVKPGRKTVKLTSSQVAIAKKLGVPLEEYAKQLKNTEGA